MKCPICGRGKTKRETRLVPYTYRGTTIQIKQPGERCDACGEGALSVEDMAATSKARHDLIARAERLLTCDEIRRVRKKLGLSQAAAGKRFGGGVNAFSRYERGETMQPRALDQLLRLLDKHPKRLKELVASEQARAAKGKHNDERSPHIGSSFDEFLKAEGIYDSVALRARQRVAAERCNEARARKTPHGTVRARFRSPRSR